MGFVMLTLNGASENSNVSMPPISKWNRSIECESDSFEGISG